MKKKKNLLKKAWKFFSGKKTIIGGAIFLAAKGGQAFFPELLPQPQYDFFQSLGEGIIAVGVGHKIIKPGKVNNAIKKGTSLFKKK